ARHSLPAHLERVVMRLSSARATGALDADADDLIDRVSQELETARAGRGVRGDARRQLIERLATLDHELVCRASRSLDEAALLELAREAEGELAPFRATMSAEAFARARESAIDRLVRQHCRLPTIAFE